MENKITEADLIRAMLDTVNEKNSEAEALAESDWDSETGDVDARKKAEEMIWNSVYLPINDVVTQMYTLGFSNLRASKSRLFSEEEFNLLVDIFRKLNAIDKSLIQDSTIFSFSQIDKKFD